MSIGKNIGAFCLGVPVGAYIAICLAIVVNEDKGFGRFAKIIETPLHWIYYGLGGPHAPIGPFFLLHLCFWSVLVGLIFLGVAVFFSWLLGSDE